MIRHQVFAVSSAVAFTVAAFILLALSVGLVGAQEADAQDTEQPEQEEYDIVADGLDNPRGLVFGPDGALYVAEAGRGGDEPCVPGPEEDTVCFGLSGAITRVSEDEGESVQERIVEGLPSLAAEGNEDMPAGSAAIGPHDIAFRNEDESYVIMGFGADPELRETFGERGGNFGELLRFTFDGGWESVVDVAGYESRENPDGGEIDSNPYSLLVVEEEMIVVDAGGNSLLRIDAEGEISTLAVFEERMVEAPEFLGLEPGSEIPMQSVPTSVAIGPDGAYYVGELTGFPFPEGQARVYRVEEGQEPEVYAEGFTNIIAIAFDDDGELLVLEIATNGLLAEDLTGALRRADGTVIASEGLFAPAGLAVGPDGAYYVSNCGICPEEGHVIRIEP